MLAQIEHKENLKTHNQVAAASSEPGAARRGSASSAQPDVTRPIPKFAGEAKENRMPRRIAIAISALMLLATLWFLGQQFWVGGEVANRGSLGDQTTSANEQLPSLPRIVDELAADGKSSNPADRKITERKSSNDSNANSDTEATATDRPGSESAPVTDTTNVKNSDPKMVLPSPEPEPRETEEPASLLKAFNAMKSQSSESTKPIETSSSDGKTLPESARWETEEDKQAARDSTDGSRKIPATVDLPVISTVSPISLFGLPDNETGDFDLELLSDENISKAKTGFEISGNANRGWTVQLTDPHDSTKTPTAVFRLAGSDLEFSWLPDSQQIPAAEYLRNCVLKCVAANSVHHIPLRSPVTIAEFVLDREENVTRIDLPELQFLPQNAIARLDKLDEEIHGITYLPDGREDRSVDRRSPLEVHFSELPEYQMVFLVLQADLKNRSRLEASVHLKLDPRQKSKPVSEKSLDGASQWLQQHFETVKLNHDNLKAMPIDELRRRLGVSSSQFKNAQKLAKVKELALQMEFSKKRAKSFREMRTQLESFYGKPIPVTVAFVVEGIEVILATTAARD